MNYLINLIKNNYKPYLIGIFIAFLMVLCADWFYDRWDIKTQFPIVITFRKMIWLEPRGRDIIEPQKMPLNKEIIITPVLPHSEEKKSSQNLNFDDIEHKVSILESGMGKNPTGFHKYCEKIGKVNIWGYAVSKDFCFDSLAEGKNRIVSWFVEETKDKTLTQALCLYNTGIVMDGCDYSNKFYNLKI